MAQETCKTCEGTGIGPRSKRPCLKCNHRRYKAKYMSDWRAKRKGKLPEIKLNEREALLRFLSSPSEIRETRVYLAAQNLLE